MGGNTGLVAYHVPLPVDESGPLTLVVGLRQLSAGVVGLRNGNANFAVSLGLCLVDFVAETLHHFRELGRVLNMNLAVALFAVFFSKVFARFDASLSTLVGALLCCVVLLCHDVSFLVVF